MIEQSHEQAFDLDRENIHEHFRLNVLTQDCVKSTQCHWLSFNWQLIVSKE